MNKLLLLVFCFFLISCSDDEINSETPNYFDENISSGNKVLMLKVDCLKLIGQNYLNNSSHMENISL